MDRDLTVVAVVIVCALVGAARILGCAWGVLCWGVR
jgi:hypothetical protein